MQIERSADYGRSWQVYRYYASHCAESYPHVHQGPIRKVDDAICDSRYSGIEPSTEGEVCIHMLIDEYTHTVCTVQKVVCKPLSHYSCVLVHRSFLGHLILRFIFLTLTVHAFRVSIIVICKDLYWIFTQLFLFWLISLKVRMNITRIEI